MNKQNLKIAIQKSGRLTADTLNLLHDSGIHVQVSDRALRARARGMNIELLFLRDDDIPEYVESGVAHAGIVGMNTLEEKGSRVTRIQTLDFGKCRLSLAVPRESEYLGLSYFSHKRIATSYPNILNRFFQERKIPVFIEKISGSVEIAVSLGLADAICDIVSTGSTLITNGLKEVEMVMESSALLIAYPNLNEELKGLLEQVIFRFTSVMHARKNRYIMLNCPKNKVDAIVRLLPGIKSPTLLPLADPEWCSLHSVIHEKDFWTLLQQLKSEGAQGILVIPIEKMIV